MNNEIRQLYKENILYLLVTGLIHSLLSTAVVCQPILLLVSTFLFSNLKAHWIECSTRFSKNERMDSDFYKYTMIFNSRIIVRKNIEGFILVIMAILFSWISSLFLLPLLKGLRMEYAIIPMLIITGIAYGLVRALRSYTSYIATKYDSKWTYPENKQMRKGRIKNIWFLSSILSIIVVFKLYFRIMLENNVFGLSVVVTGLVILTIVETLMLPMYHLYLGTSFVKMKSEMMLETESVDSLVESEV